MQVAQQSTEHCGTTPFQQDQRFDEFVRHTALLCSEMDVNHALDYHEDNGLYLLGGGCWSRVYQCPWDDQKAIKVSNTQYSPDGWLEWAHYCIANRHWNNPLLPVIFDLRVFQHFTIALLERYDDTVEDADLSEWHYSALKNVMDYMPDAEETFYDDVFRDWIINSDIHLARDYAAHAAQIFNDPDAPYMGDCGWTNIMVYGDRLILTDPCGNWSSSEREFSIELLRAMGVYVDD